VGCDRMVIKRFTSAYVISVLLAFDHKHNSTELDSILDTYHKHNSTELGSILYLEKTYYYPTMINIIPDNQQSYYIGIFSWL
jgi:hypothetical protein